MRAAGYHPLKIAQLTYSYKPIIGGADAYADLLCTTLRERDHEVWVYQRAADTDDPFVRTAPRWQRPLAPRDFWLVPWWLRTRSELAGMDVLVAHYPNYCAPAYSHPQLVGLSHGVTWDDAPDSWRARRKKRMAEGAFRRCGRFVANDTFFLREMGLDIAPGERLFEEIAPGRWFIPNCVDTHRFSPADDNPTSEREPVVVVPRNLYRNRGVHLAVQAFGLLSGEHPHLRMDLVGAESQPDYAREIRAMVVALGLQDRVRFAGSVPWGEMPGVYREAQVCLIPSVCGEGTSLSALEAMACGTATITTDVGGLPDLPTVHCRPTAEGLARAIREVLGKLDEVAGRQRAEVVETFGIERWKLAWARVVEEW